MSVMNAEERIYLSKKLNFHCTPIANLIKETVNYYKKDI